ncbi:PEP-CTERM sorting domain-containing protein [Paludibaculum fermentans]|uniref:PEP-CTERM sorting domain-containing protein n=1 Tax=Paludibaculum fermentans TaxID=1473598 RepID=UPI003EBE4F9F
MFISRLGVVLGLLACQSIASAAAIIQLQSLEAYIHYGGSSVPKASFTSASPEYTSALDAENLGSFSFTWTNLTGSDISNLRFTLFLDPDIDRDNNSFFNEYGDYLSNALPVLAPVGALPFSSWEIDEPEYVFGNIYTHTLTGALDETIGVPSSAPDDVSAALQFLIQTLHQGQSLYVFGTLSLTDAAGLQLVDPDSNVALYFNAYAQLGPYTGPPPPPPSGVPEPGTAVLFVSGLALCLSRRIWTSVRSGRQ